MEKELPTKELGEHLPEGKGSFSLAGVKVGLKLKE